MSKKPETLFKERVFRDLKRLNLRYGSTIWYTKVQQVVKRGDPDIILCVKGRFVALELKKDSNEKPTPLQQWELDWIANARGMAFICYPGNWEPTLQAIEELAKPDGDDYITDSQALEH